MFKTTTLAAAAILGTASIASAEDYIINFDTIDEDKASIQLETVLTDMDGVVEIYEFNMDEMGMLLGTQEVSAGANADVLINLDRTTENDLIAVLRVNGQIVAREELDVEDES